MCIFEEGELYPQVVVREFRTTTQHGAIEGKTQTNTTRFYNLSMHLAVGNEYMKLVPLFTFVEDELSIHIKP